MQNRWVFLIAGLLLTASCASSGDDDDDGAVVVTWQVRCDVDCNVACASQNNASFLQCAADATEATQIAQAKCEDIQPCTSFNDPSCPNSFFVGCNCKIGTANVYDSAPCAPTSFAPPRENLGRFLRL